MQLRTLIIVALLAVAMFFLPAAVGAQSSDPVVITTTYVHGLNTGNAAAAAAVLADSAVLTNTPVPAGTTAVVVGSPNIQALLAQDAAKHVNLVVVGGYHVAGHTVTWHVVRTDDGFRRFHIAGPEITMTAVVRNGKIVTITQTYSPDALAKYAQLKADEASSANATSPSLPNTGEGGMAVAAPSSTSGPWNQLAPLLLVLAIIVGSGALLVRLRHATIDNR